MRANLSNFYQKTLDNPTNNVYNDIIKPLQARGLFKNYSQVSNPVRLYDEHLVVNTVMPPGILTLLSPNTIEFYFHKQSADELIGVREKIGDWQKNTVFIAAIEESHITSRYGDFAPAPLVDFNSKVKGYGHFRYQAGVRVGNLEEKQNEEMGGIFNALQLKTRSAMNSLRRRFNDIAFFGALGTPQAPLPPGTTNNDVHGIVNSPLLNPVVQENTKITAMTNDQVIAFFTKYFNILSTQSGCHVNENDSVRIGLPPAAYNSLISRWTPMGRPLLEQLKLVYSNTKIIKCQELENAGGAGSDMAIFIVDKPELGGVPNTVTLGYSEQAMFSNVVQDETGLHFKIMEGSFGCIFYKPSLISRCKGI